MTRLIIYVIFTAITFTTNLIAQEARPQEPIGDVNYTSEDVTFTNSEANNIKLAGTLTLPKGVKNPAVAILISGSGPQNRDSYIKSFNHKPFLVLSHYLTQQGIAVLRYDDRGVAESEGDFKSATSLDFASDVTSAVNYLKTRSDINPNKIGLIGHSEGGLIAPIVASANKDVAFAVLLAGPGVDGATVLETQYRKSMELRGVPKASIDENEKLTTIIYGVIKNNTDEEIIKTKITKQLKEFKVNNPDSPISPMITDTMINQQLGILQLKWVCAFIRIDPVDYLSKTNCPVLALNGSKDVQVVSELNLNGIKKGLEQAQNKDLTIKELEGLNHLFQKAETGSVEEYAKIEETYNPEALSLISNWINKRF